MFIIYSNWSIFFLFGNKAGKHPALLFLAWDHKDAVKATLRIALFFFFPIYINEYNWRKQVKDKFSILKEMIMLSLSRKCITFFALILDEYNSILNTLFIHILSAHEIYVSPLHCILLHFFYPRVSAIKVYLISNIGNFSWCDNLLHCIIKFLWSLMPIKYEPEWMKNSSQMISLSRYLPAVLI